MCITSNVLITNSTISHSQGALSLQRSSLWIIGSVFTGNAYTDNRGFRSASILIEDCPIVQIYETSFTRNIATGFGGALFIISNRKNPGIAELVSCRFVNNSSPIGGAIDVYSSSIRIANSLFDSNRANEGGGLYIEASLFWDSPSTIINCSFLNNSASVQGGAVLVSIPQYTVLDSIFANNTAPYGKDLASFPVAMRLQNASQTIVVASGQTLRMTLILELIDHFNQTYSIDSSSVGQIISGDSYTTVSGNTKVVAVEGEYVFNDFSVISNPNSTATLLVRSSLLNEALCEVSEIGHCNQLYRLEIQVRSCEIGEELVGKECVVCGSGTYSLSAGKQCSNCPSGAHCYGNYTMAPKKGYWRDNAMSDTFYQCPNVDACLGGEDPFNATGLCAKGYRSNLCNGCSSGYSQSGQASCLECNEYAYTVLILTAYAIAYSAIVSMLIYQNLKTVFKPKSLLSVYLRVLVNYIQLTIILTSFKLDWPGIIVSINSFNSEIGAMSNQIVDLGCVTSGNTEFVKALIVSFIPIIAFALILIFWSMSKLIFNTNKTIDYIISSMVVSVFIFHSMLTKTMFELLKCTELNKGEYWLTSNLSVRCWDDSHIAVIYSCIVPSIIVWSIGFPALVLSILCRRRQSLEGESVKLRYGFLYRGYKPKVFFWEFAVLYRKILVIMCSVFLADNIPVQALVVTMILLGCMYFQNKTKPFVHDNLNSLEIRGILVAFVSIYFGMFFITKRIGWEAKILMVVLIVLVNFLFLLSWFQSASKTLLITLHKRFRCFRKSFKKCGLDVWFYKFSNASQTASVIPDNSIIKLAVGERPINVSRQESFHNLPSGIQEDLSFSSSSLANSIYKDDDSSHIELESQLSNTISQQSNLSDSVYLGHSYGS